MDDNTNYTTITWEKQIIKENNYKKFYLNAPMFNKF